MPRAYTQLKAQGHPRTCPACGARFQPFMRGQIVRTAWWLIFRPFVRQPKPWRPWCLICEACKEIVGYEAPGLGCETLPPRTFRKRSKS